MFKQKSVSTAGTGKNGGGQWGSQAASSETQGYRYSSRRGVTGIEHKLE